MVSLELVLAALGAYLIGSIPFGLILTHVAGLGDIRNIGSGNIGATNVLRTGSKKLAALTLFLDGAKGAVVVLVTQAFALDFIPHALVHPHGLTTTEFSTFITFMGVAAILGHMFPIWLKFKGGKGVATFFGVILALFPAIGVTALLIWLSTALITRESSTSALMATLYIALMFWGFLSFTIMSMPDPWHTATQEMPFMDAYSCVFITLMVILIWIRHHENIKRLLNGTEPKIGKKS